MSEAQNLILASYGPKMASKRPKMAISWHAGPLRNPIDPGRCFLDPKYAVETGKADFGSSKFNSGELPPKESGAIKIQKRRKSI